MLFYTPLLSVLALGASAILADPQPEDALVAAENLAAPRDGVESCTNWTPQYGRGHLTWVELQFCFVNKADSTYTIVKQRNAQYFLEPAWYDAGNYNMEWYGRITIDNVRYSLYRTTSGNGNHEQPLGRKFYGNTTLDIEYSQAGPYWDWFKDIRYHGAFSADLGA